MVKKKKTRSEPEENRSKPLAESDHDVCPLCKKGLPLGKCFYCPHCHGEIDYLLYARITDISEEKKREMEKNAASLYPYFAVIGVYAMAWLLLYAFILRNCLGFFVNQR